MRACNKSRISQECDATKHHARGLEVEDRLKERLLRAREYLRDLGAARRRAVALIAADISGRINGGGMPAP